MVFRGHQGTRGKTKRSLRPRASSVPRAPLAQRPQDISRCSSHGILPWWWGFSPNVADVASLSTPWSYEFSANLSVKALLCAWSRRHTISTRGNKCLWAQRQPYHRLNMSRAWAQFDVRLGKHWRNSHKLSWSQKLTYNWVASGTLGYSSNHQMLYACEYIQLYSWGFVCV